MFTTEELQAIDDKYFRMIVLDPYDLTIQSKYTGHYWYLHSTGYPSDGSCILRSLADSDAFQSGRCAAHNGRPETLAIIN